MTEAQLVRKITDALRKAGCWVLKLHGGPMQLSGIPDLLVVRDGKAHFFEVKLPGKKATKLQQHRIDQLRGHGAVAEVVTSVEEAMQSIQISVDYWDNPGLLNGEASKCSD